MAEKKQLKNPLPGIVKYFKEVKSELKKVSWPSLKQIQNNTIIVLVCILIIGAFIWVLDFTFQQSFGRVINYYQADSQAAPPDYNDYGNPGDYDAGNGGGVTVDENGYLIDENGELVLGEDGEPIFVDMNASADTDGEPEADGDEQ